MKDPEAGKIALLLVEDDEDFSLALIPRLVKRNFDVETALTAEEALDKLNSGDFDAIVADIKLPGIDGIEFLAKVRERNRDLPVVLITGYASLESAKEAVKLNASDYLLKPLESIDELLDPIYKSVYAYRLSLENKRLAEDLQQKIKELEKKNIALREVLEQIESEKKRMKDDIFSNVDKLLLPSLERLKRRAISLDARLIDILHKNLRDLTSPFGRKITAKDLNLTPREIVICDMIKNGLTTKEISEHLNISLPTAERHRNNIRNKVGIVRKDINLTTYLQRL